MTTLGSIRRTSRDPGRDLWPRFRERLAAEDGVELRMPPVTWPVVVAGVVAAGTLVVVSEPAHLLAACGLL